MSKTVIYEDDKILHLEDMEAIRLRYGMYIGHLGDGSQYDDGMYILLKEVMDNAIDEFKITGTKVIVNISSDNHVFVRDYGRGIELSKLLITVSKLHTGGKFKTNGKTKSVGLNGVGIKLVNGLSSIFEISSFRDGEVRKLVFSKGKLLSDETFSTSEENGIAVSFDLDNELFHEYKFQERIILSLFKNFIYLNNNLLIVYNGTEMTSKGGLKDLLQEKITAPTLYDIVHFKGEDIEIAFTHTDQSGEDYYSFVNGQYTSQGGTHQSALKEYLARAIKEYHKKNCDNSTIRNGLIAAISIHVNEPMFEGNTKTKFSCNSVSKDGITINKLISDFVVNNIDNYLHKNTKVADIILQRIKTSEAELKDISCISKQTRERIKKVSLHNSKLRDCKLHYNDNKGKDEELQSTIFITEGDSASGSITKVRDVLTQAVFSLRGKPLNTYGLTKKVVYENEEFNLLQAALNIENGIDGLRYNKVIVATDADVDGMHIRLLMITFFLQFFPELIRTGHVYILQTPLFRVRNRKKRIKKSVVEKYMETHPDSKGDFITQYCYSEEERVKAIDTLGPDPEITRFKGLGEISPDEFKNFIGPDIRLESVTLRKTDQVKELLEYYMGKNTMQRQNFIINNLVIEEDKPEEDTELAEEEEKAV